MSNTCKRCRPLLNGIGLPSLVPTSGCLGCKLLLDAVQYLGGKSSRFPKVSRNKDGSFIISDLNKTLVITGREGE
jgi:hypothetical protein